MSAATTSLEQKLLSDIREKYSAYIEPACKGTVFPASLLAALTANETGLDPTKTRFESSVFVDLAQVLAGTKANFGSIGADDISGYIAGVRPGAPLGWGPSPAATSSALASLATSWGPTQIMGYQVMTLPLCKVADLLNLTLHFEWTVRLLIRFQREFHLSGDFTDETGDASAYFRCWNTGRPDGQTFDPHYAENGLRRMRIYESLPPRPCRGESEQQ